MSLSATAPQPLADPDALRLTGSMDFPRSLPSPEHSSFPVNLRPVRRRLQKFTPKANIFSGKRHSEDSQMHASRSRLSSSAPRHMSAIDGLNITKNLGHNPFADEPLLPLPPDLSDSKWLDYIESSGLMFPEQTVTESVPKPMRKKRPPPIIPELSHLARVNGARASIDSNSSGSVPNSASTASTMRRQAKTPVFRIGQLEGKGGSLEDVGVSFGRDPWIAEKTSSVELIAEQYNALLEHRDALAEERERQEEEREREEEERERQRLMEDEVSSIYSTSSVYTAYQSDPPVVQRSDTHKVPRKPVPQHMSEESPVNIILEPVRNSALIAQYSPASSDGTYIGVDESAIYFKPVSFSQTPPPQSRPTEVHVPLPSSSPSQMPTNGADSLSLQICLDLLTKELSSAFADRSKRAGGGPGGSALQVWVMIEAYERLQDQIACMDNVPEAHKLNMQMVFRSWLGTLYAVHDMLSSKPSVDEREVEGLAEAVD
ncbi:hypothetical protein LIA77_09637 [Sarocladium implicatum]|nr:hypothetical protein LIA77_09637 [Sarocladium implicatum]